MDDMDEIGWEIPTFSREEGERRHRKIRELMALRGIDCLVIAGHLADYKGAAANIRYVSNFCPWFDEQYIVFPLEGEAILLVWSTRQSSWGEKVSWLPVKTVSVKRRRERDYVGDIVGKITELGLKRGTIGIEDAKTMPAYVYSGLLNELPHANFVPGGDIPWQCRLIKSSEELEFIRKSGECADKGFEAMAEVACAGVTEAELVACCESAMIRAGAETGNFILLGSAPWSEWRGVPMGGSQSKVRKGDIILNEITSCYGGYYTQLCRPIAIGDPPRDFIELFEIHKELYELVSKELRPGNTTDQIENELREVAFQRADFARAWALQSTELAEAGPRLNLELEAGMAYVNHPWTSFRSGRGLEGHTIGDTFIVTKDGCEGVSKLSTGLIVI